MRVATALGVEIQRYDDKVLVRGGLGLDTAGRLDDGPILASCGESGLCMRMFSSIAALLPREVELHGEGSLARRPVGMVEGPLAELGVACETAGGFPPVRVRGPLRAGMAEVDGSESSQFLTGLLLALPMAGGGSVLSVSNLASRGYIDLTLDVARAFGADISRDAGFTEFRVYGSKPYTATEYDVEGDWSGAAFLLVAGALSAGPVAVHDGVLEVTGLSLSSSQPDRAIIDALQLAGAPLERIEGGWRVGRAPLSGFSFDASDCPDLFPPLVALASRCAGVTKIRGASRLRAKESDRAAALAGEFGRLGLRVDVDGDEMAVTGLGPGERIAAGTVSSHGDHRIAMAAAVAALAGSGPVVIEGAESVAKSYPDFFEALAQISHTLP